MNRKLFILLASTILVLWTTSTNSKGMNPSMLMPSVSAMSSQWTKFELPAKILLPLSQFRPGLPIRPGATKPTTVTYSRSATAGNMVTPAILLGAPIMVIIALIIIAMKGD
jgi:hypothetical protein